MSKAKTTVPPLERRVIQLVLRRLPPIESGALYFSDAWHYRTEKLVRELIEKR